MFLLRLFIEKYNLFLTKIHFFFSYAERLRTKLITLHSEKKKDQIVLTPKHNVPENPFVEVCAVKV